ncbi:hypothetical protein BHM03_00058918 [Ensete ventricosum]|nr:hypothetical protein BHM03_00058918 [Ensete ventricosum]
MGRWDGSSSKACCAVARDSDAAGELGCVREGRWWPKERAAVVADEGYGYGSNCAGEVKREGCQTSDVDANRRAGPESSNPRMRMALAMGAVAMLYFCRETKIVTLQKRNRPTVAALQKGSQRVGICCRLIARRNLLRPLCRATRDDRRWLLQVLLAERTKAAGGMAPASRCRSHRLL